MTKPNIWKNNLNLYYREARGENSSNAKIN
jgi:hypothetical protein